MTYLDEVTAKIRNAACASATVDGSKIRPDDIPSFAKLAKLERCAIAIEAPDAGTAGIFMNRASNAGYWSHLIIPSGAHTRYVVLNGDAAPGFLLRLANLTSKEAA